MFPVLNEFNSLVVARRQCLFHCEPLRRLAVAVLDVYLAVVYPPSTTTVSKVCPDELPLPGQQVQVSPFRPFAMCLLLRSLAKTVTSFTSRSCQPLRQRPDIQNGINGQRSKVINVVVCAGSRQIRIVFRIVAIVIIAEILRCRTRRGEEFRVILLGPIEKTVGTG